MGKNHGVAVTVRHEHRQVDRANSLQHAVISEVDRKIRSIAKPRNYTFRPVLIHVNGVDDALMEERYFDTIIDFSELWS